ncbi:hypothetical protein GCM10011316_09110 [Roseibium aquae]|uniref:AsmA domain-containing protein n=1 Tax=Roseibium aquae TaxID=1323746 RepID=A0A916TBM2_9HYPH|nr:AsmA family protein [Roseibium aquae]GGB39252.1 hypothetical protein GCM10011316_09110 [Roseibium aquae]
MRRLLIGLFSLAFMLATAILVIPFFLPKDAIRSKVIAEIDRQYGWRLRLDGPVSLSLFPGFALNARDVGLSGEAGADGIEFARAERIDVQLAWGGLITGDIRVTGLDLESPDILLEIGPVGLTSWAPRRDLDAAGLTGDQADGALAGTGASENTNGAGTADGTLPAILQRVGIDRLSISDGRLRYADLRTQQRLEIAGLDLVLTAPSLTGTVDLDSSFTFQGAPFDISGSMDNPIAFAEGKMQPVNLSLASGETELLITGSAGASPLAMDLAISAGGPSLRSAAELAGLQLATDPGRFSIEASVSGDDRQISVANLSAALAAVEVSGSLDADLTGSAPRLTGRLMANDAPLADIVALAGQNRPAGGTVGVDVSFETGGANMPALLASLSLSGSVAVENGEVGGLDLAPAFDGDETANSIRDIDLMVQIAGVTQPITLSGALGWRDERFTLTGTAGIAPLLAGLAAPVEVNVKGQRLSAGFKGEAAASGALNGAVSVETANLRELLAWAGQPIGAGAGLRQFKASGLFSIEENAIAFDETQFVLDETSGKASGRIQTAGKPNITADLVLNEIVLDPYLSQAGADSGAGAPPPSGQGGARQAARGWSTDAIDFSGLNAANAAFSISTNAIRWEAITVGRSRLTANIQNGVLTANLAEMQLYEGNGTGQVVLNGAAGLPQVQAAFALKNLNAYPALRDAADFEWIEGRAELSLEISAQGGSQRELVQGLNGTAAFTFLDGAIRGLNIPRMVRGLSVETLLGWQENPAEKTDFNSLGANFSIANGIASSSDLAMIGPLVRVNGTGRTDMPQQQLDWRIEPRIVPSLEGQAPAPRPKGADKTLAGLGVPVIVRGSWDQPQIYPDISGILENPEAAYRQLQSMGGELFKSIQDAPAEVLADQANEVIRRVTGGNTQIDVQKVIDGDVNDEDVLKAVEEGFGLPPGLLGSFGAPFLGNSGNNNPQPQPNQ